MLMNRRKSERRPCRRGAKIQFGTCSLPRDCTITDVSKGGVKVIAEYLDIPNEFTIILSTGDPRQCRLAWRICWEQGGQFIASIQKPFEIIETGWRSWTASAKSAPTHPVWSPERSPVWPILSECRLLRADIRTLLAPCLLFILMAAPNGHVSAAGFQDSG